MGRPMRTIRTSRRLASFAALFALAVVGCVGSANAGPFDRGSTQISLTVGNGRAFDQNYTVYGAGFSYYVRNGLAVGLDAESWRGATPTIDKVSPHASFVWRLSPQLNPYLGGFYRHVSIDGYDDRNSYGVRAGVYMRSGRRAYLGAGIVYDRLLNCDAAVYKECSTTYPEFHLLFTL